MVNSGNATNKVAVSGELMELVKEAQAAPNRDCFNNIDLQLREACGKDQNSFREVRTEIFEQLLSAIAAALQYPSQSEIAESAISFLTGLKCEDLPHGIKLRWRNQDQDDPLYQVDKEYFATLSRAYLKSLSPTEVAKLSYRQVRHFVKVFSDCDGQKQAGPKDQAGWREFSEITAAATV